VSFGAFGYAKNGLEICVFVSQNVNLMLQYWDGEQLQQSDAMLVTELDIAIRSIDYVTNLLCRDVTKCPHIQ